MCLSRVLCFDTKLNFKATQEKDYISAIPKCRSWLYQKIYEVTLLSETSVWDTMSHMTEGWRGPF